MKSKITIQDIARLAHVSKTTVSHYLNGHYDKMSAETKERIRNVISETDYHPSTAARSLNSKQTRLLGVIIGDITSAFSNQLIKGLTDYVQKHVYQLILASSGYLVKNEQKYIQSMYDMGVDGFLVQPSPQFAAMWESLHIKKPLVYFDSPPQDTTLPYVKTDSFHAVSEATEMAVKRGYTHFLMVSADPGVIVTRQERSRGFCSCLEKHGISYDVLTADRETSLKELRDSIAPLILRYDELCIFAANNWLLKKTFQALEDFRSFIPKRLGIYGMDAYEWNNLVVPPITTILQPAEEEGIAAGRLLIQSIESTDAHPQSCVLACAINEQVSTMR